MMAGQWVHNKQTLPPVLTTGVHVASCQHHRCSRGLRLNPASLIPIWPVPYLLPSSLVFAATSTHMLPYIYKTGTTHRDAQVLVGAQRVRRGNKYTVNIYIITYIYIHLHLQDAQVLTDASP